MFVLLTLNSNLGNAVSFLMAPAVVPDPPSNGTNGAVDVDVLVDGNSTAGLATNSIFFCFLFVKSHWLAWRGANQ